MLVAISQTLHSWHLIAVRAAMAKTEANDAIYQDYTHFAAALGISSQAEEGGEDRVRFLDRVRDRMALLQNSLQTESLVAVKLQYVQPLCRMYAESCSIHYPDPEDV